MSESSVAETSQATVENPAIRNALRAVKREHFYRDVDGPADGAHSSRLDGVTITPPDVVAKMIEALELDSESNVLQVGTGTGFVAAVISRIAMAVFSVERDIEVAKKAQAALAGGGFKNVQVLYGPNLKQYAANAPYDGILISAGMLQLPQRLAKRLSIGGRLVAPVGRGRNQRLVRLTRTGEDDFRQEDLGQLRVRPLLGDILVEMGVVDREDVELAAIDADVKGTRLGEALLEGQYVEEHDIYRALAAQRGWGLVTAQEVLDDIDRDLVASFPKVFLTHNRIIPINRADGMLHVATTDMHMDVEELAQALAIQTVDVLLITPSDYQLVWTSLEQEATKRGDAERSVAVIDKEAHFDATTIAFFEKLIKGAVKARASDIHFERHERDVRIRFRVDGELRERADFRLSPNQLAGVVQLVKVSGRMEPSVRRRPQSGHFQRRIGDTVLDIRARTQPGLYGETVVLRILPQDAKVLTIEDLGFTTDVSLNLRGLLARPSGIILVTGPSGSGKSTTLYACLHATAEDDTRKAVTVEHPISYALAGVQQIKCDPDGGFDLASAIEAVSRDDADVILVGDINEQGAAERAIKASQSGHLVLATVNGRRAIDGIRMFQDLGVQGPALAGELLAVIAQRLVRRVCPDCREREEPDSGLLEPIFAEGIPGDFVSFSGQGCEACGKHGTRGRIAVTEYLPVEHELRAALERGATISELRAVSNLWTTMLDTGVRFVKAGVIPQSELRWIPH